MSKEDIERFITMQAGQIAALGAVCRALLRSGFVERDSFMESLSSSADELMKAGAPAETQHALVGVIDYLVRHVPSGEGSSGVH